MKFICCQLVASMLMSPAWSLRMVSHRWEVGLVSTWPCGSAIWNVRKDQLFFSTDFSQPITVTDSFQNYCMTSHLCSLECLKRSTLFSLQIFTCPSQWQLPKLLHNFTSLQFRMFEKINIVLPTDFYLSITVTASQITAQLHVSAVWNVRKDQHCSPYRFLPVHHSDRRLPKLLHDFTALQFGMFEKISFVLPTDFYLSIIVTDGFQNYCMTSQLCSLECLKRSALFSLQIFTCPS